MAAKRNKMIRATKLIGGGALPSYLSLAQRQFEKSAPTGQKTTIGVEYIIPVDLLTLCLGPELTQDIEEVTVGYSKQY